MIGNYIHTRLKLKAANFFLFIVLFIYISGACPDIYNIAWAILLKRNEKQKKKKGHRSKF